MVKRVQIVVSGRVQGVCFRMYTCSEARGLGLAGYVRNRTDGTVEVVAEGEEDVLKALVDWCRRGPSYASVQNVDFTYLDADNSFSGFEITY